MKTISFAPSIALSPLDELTPTLGLGARFRDPALRRVYLEIDSNGLGDVVNVVPLIQEILEARPDVDVIVVSSQWRIPFRWCGERVSTAPTAPPPAERNAPGALYIDISGDLHYHIYAPHWLQMFFIAGIGQYTPHGDPFPLIDNEPLNGFPSRLTELVGPSRGYILLHLENTRREWEGRNTDPQNLLAIARKLTASGYRILEIGNDNPASGEFVPLGKLTLEELVYAMKHCAGFVGIDSFPMHIAALYDKPLLGFFAATFPDVVLPPVSRLTVMRNEALACNGCVYITRPLRWNKCTLGQLECTHALPEAYLHDRFVRFLETIESPAGTELPMHALEHSWRMAQLHFDEAVLLDRIRGKWLLSNQLRRRAAASVSSELT